MRLLNNVLLNSIEILLTHGRKFNWYFILLVIITIKIYISSRWTIPGPPLPNPNTPKNDITAGYVEVYDKYTYCTVRGAGHEAPQYQPHFASAMFNRFLTNGTI